MVIDLNIKLGIIGGDTRYGYLANALARKGCGISMAALESGIAHPPYIKKEKDWRTVAQECNVLLLPIPVCGDRCCINTPLSDERIPLDALLALTAPDTLLLGGVVTPAVAQAAGEYGREIIDLMAREDLAIATAVPTAEGAIAIAMQETVGTVFGARCFVLGCGRVARALARRLAGLGARVSIYARRDSDLAWAAAEGYRARPLYRLESEISQAEIIFNTAPAQLLDARTLDAVESDALIVDLASKPGGVDFSFAAQAGIKTIWALSLPGKVAPKYAGECLAMAVQNLLAERGLPL